MHSPQTLPKFTTTQFPTMFRLVTRQPHKYGPTRHVLPNVSPSNKEQFERTCLNCPLVRITVIGDAHARQYRFGNGAQFVDHAGAPECVAVPDVIEGKVG